LCKVREVRRCAGRPPRRATPTQTAFLTFALLYTFVFWGQAFNFITPQKNFWNLIFINWCPHGGKIEFSFSLSNICFCKQNLYYTYFSEGGLKPSSLPRFRIQCPPCPSIDKLFLQLGIHGCKTRLRVWTKNKHKIIIF
jgi:hypothetical protein